MAQKRIAKELQECTTSPPPNYTISLPDPSNIHIWHATLTGPASTPYISGQFGILISLPADYPFKPPTISFITRIYHPNITNDAKGSICLPGLKSENWKPASRLWQILDGVRELLVAPNPDDPLETGIADEFRRDRAGFEKVAREYVGKYAKGPVKWPLVGS